MEQLIKKPLTIEGIPTNEKWQKYFLGAEFASAIQKYLVLILSEKSSEGVKNAMDALKHEFLSKSASIPEKKEYFDGETLISIFGIVSKYLGELFFKSEEAVEKIYILRELINIAIVISKDREFNWSAVRKVNAHVSFLTLFNTFGDNTEFLRLVSSFYVLRPRRGRFQDEDDDVLQAISNLLPVVDATTQGCLVAAGGHIANTYKKTLSFEQKEQFNDAVVQFLSQTDPSLAKLMAALHISATQTRTIDGQPVENDFTNLFVSVLADYVKWCDEYEATLKEGTMNKVYNLPRQIISCVKEEFESHEKSFYEQSLNNLKQSRTSNATHYSVEMLLLLVIEAPLVPGTKIIDLPDTIKSFLEALTTIDHIWKNPLVSEMLAKYKLPSTRETMQSFIADTSNDGPIRFPEFKTLDTIPWAAFEHAYDTAENITKYLRQLCSQVPSARQGALQNIWDDIVRRGRYYESSLYVIPFLFELVEATLVQDKGEIVRVFTELLTYCAPDFLTKVDGLDLEMDWGPHHDNFQIRLSIEDKFTQKLQTIIGLLSNESSEVRGWAAYLLGLLRSSARESVPKLQERYETETDSKVKSSLLLAISLLYWPQSYNDDDDAVTPSFVEHVKQQYETIRGTQSLALEFATFSWLLRLGTDNKPLIDKRRIKEDIKRFLMEPEEFREQRANHVISNPKEFLLKVIVSRNYRDLLPCVIQLVRSSNNNYIGDIACKTMFYITFHPYGSVLRRRAHLQYCASQEQIQVVTEAAEYLTHTRLWCLNEVGLPHDKETCEEFLAEARVIEDLYGDD